MQDVPPGKTAVENIFWTSGAPHGKYSVSVINYSATHEVGFTLLVSGGGEKQIGGSTQQDMRSFDNILTTPQDGRIAAGPGEDPIMRPGQTVCEFEFSSTTDPIRYLWVMPSQSPAAREKAAMLLVPSGEPTDDYISDEWSEVDDGVPGPPAPLFRAPLPPGSEQRRSRVRFQDGV